MKDIGRLQIKRLLTASAGILATTTLLHLTLVSAQQTLPAPVKKMQDSAMQNMERFMAMPAGKQKSYMETVQDESLKRGKASFEDTTLGTNGFACVTCHPGGKTNGGSVPMGKIQMPIPSLEGVAANFPKFKIGNDAVITLADMDNNCIVMFLNGTPLATDSQKARDLAFYVSRFSSGTPYTPGKQGM